MRKVFPVLAAVFVLALCVVPVMATSGVGPHERMLQSTVPIKAVGFSDDTIVDWPNNSFSLGGRIATVTAFDGKFVANCYGSEDYIETDFRYTGANSFRFYLADFFLASDDSFRISAALESNIVFTGIRIAGNLMTVRSSSDFFVLDSQYFQASSENIETYGVDLFSYLRKALDSYEGYNADSLNFLSSVVIDVNFYVESSDTPSDFINVQISQGVPVSYQTWFDSQRLASKIQAPGMFLWLRQSLDEFLDFEIYPGVSFNRVFYIVFIIGIVLWIFKAVH